jgi:hypothetical protein
MALVAVVIWLAVGAAVGLTIFWLAQALRAGQSAGQQLQAYYWQVQQQQQQGFQPQPGYGYGYGAGPVPLGQQQGATPPQQSPGPTAPSQSPQPSQDERQG